MSGVDKQRRKGQVVRLLKRVWALLLVVVMTGIGGYAIFRIRATLAAEPAVATEAGTGDQTNPLNPKHVTYEVSGSGRANLNYLDENGQPHDVQAAALPWSLTIITTLPSMSANIVAQGGRATSGLRCRVVVDGQLRDDRSTDEYQPFIYCLVKMV